MTEKLLPCPFCGGEASLALTNREDERSGYRATFSAYCKTCSGMTARTSTTDKNGWNNEGDESIKRRVTEAWNRRTPAPEGEGKRRMLVDLDGAPFGSEFLDNLNGYATGGSGRCLDILTMWGANLYASPVVPVGREDVEIVSEWLEIAKETPKPLHSSLNYVPVCASEIEAIERILAALGTKATDTGGEA